MGNPSDAAAETQIVKKQLSYPEVEKLARAFVASGMFGRDMDKISKGITKIMAGQELGLAPFASMRAVHVIEGNATLSANTMAGMVKSSGRYDYEVKKKEVDICEIDFFEYRNGKRVKIGTETFDKDEAQAAGLLHKNNWKSYPKAMMFARCISNGVRTYCPDVFSGMLVYTPDELGGRVDHEGNYIDVDPKTGEVLNDPKDDKKAEEKSEDPADKDIDQRPEEEQAASEKGEQNIMDDQENPIDPPEEDAPAEDPVEPEVEVTDEFKEELLKNLDSLGLSGRGKIAIVKETTGSINPKMIKADQKWRDLHTKVMAFLNSDEEIPADWLPQEEPAKEEEVEDGDNKQETLV